MKVLGIDVCTGFCSVALIDRETTLATKHEPMTRGHVERLAPMVAEVLEEARLSPTDMNGIAVSTGPGSFTGARLGVSFARGFALATGIPTAGISVFAAMRDGIDAETIVALPGKNGSLLLQRFDANGAPRAAPADYDANTAVQIVPEAGAFTIVGTAAEAFRALLPSERQARGHQTSHSDVSGEAIARLGALQMTKGSPPPPAPLYVRAADAKPQATVSLS